MFRMPICQKSSHPLGVSLFVMLVVVCGCTSGVVFKVDLQFVAKVDLKFAARFIRPVSARLQVGKLQVGLLAVHCG